MTQATDTININALIDATHGDPFALLGPHISDDGLSIRAFFPNAQAVAVVSIEDDREHLLTDMDCLDVRGFYACTLTDISDSLSYVFDVDWGHTRERLQDPYRFGSHIREMDTWLLAEGNHHRPYEVFGAHPMLQDGVEGVNFCVWAPNAKRVSVVGDFNYWDGRRHPMRLHPQIGVWELFIPAVKVGQCYKYELLNAHGNITIKADPFALQSQLRPDTASVVAHLPMPVEQQERRRDMNDITAPISIYEVHLGSWRRNVENNYWLSYDQLADELIPYVKGMGFTHIELLPIHEFPFDGSWGYQPIGLYSPTSRFGDADAFKRFIERAHQHDINVIIDWVPGHFPSDEHGLREFDGTALYEHADPREGYHQDWNTLIYNFGRNEVKNFLSSNALYWLECFGVDGLRVDAVASMIYRDYSRDEGEWIANQHGGRENLEAINFLRYTNHVVGTQAKNAVTVAEESTAFPGVSRPPAEDGSSGGLGFHFKWNMGWMNDTLSYMQQDPIHRQYHHDKLTFGMLYNYSENFILPISHDEVVHGKGSMLDKMPGDSWQKFANLRAYYGYMWGYPGKKLLFMGCEFAQGREWDYQESLDWYLLEEQHGGKWHSGVQELVKDLNRHYRNIAALHQLDADPAGFEWLVADDNHSSVFAFQRYDSNGNCVMVVSNFTPVVRQDYRIGVHRHGHYQEIFNSDAGRYCGSDVGNKTALKTEDIAAHGKPCSLSLTLPPLATVYLRFDAVT